MFRLRPTRKIASATLALFVSLTASVAATEFQPFDRAGQVRGSDVIARGAIVRSAARWSTDGSAIVTEADLAIDEVWKGSPDADRITVRTLGGVVGGVRLEVEGAAALATGEHVVLFLRREADGAYSPWGMRFGKYDVRDAGGKAIAVGTMPPVSRATHDYPEVALPLDAFRAEVTALVADSR